jgi:hypothetical protein
MFDFERKKPQSLACILKGRRSHNSFKLFLNFIMSITSARGVMDLVLPGELDDYSIETGMWHVCIGRKRRKDEGLIAAM